MTPKPTTGTEAPIITGDPKPPPRLHVSPSVERAEHAQAKRDPNPGRRAMRAEQLAKAHHAEMGQAMRYVTGQAVAVGAWADMPAERRQIMVEVMRAMLDKGVIV